MLKSTFSCCKVYISETRNKSALNSIEQAAKLSPEAAIVNKSEDDTYNKDQFVAQIFSFFSPNMKYLKTLLLPFQELEISSNSPF